MILDSWTDEQTAKMHKATFKAQHRLSSTGLFTDDALADLLDKHPRDKLDVCARADHDVFEFKFRTGDVRDVDGKTIMEAAKKGAIWMNVREAMNLHPEYKAVLDEMYGELAEHMGHRKPYEARGGLLISSPTAKVPYHFDATQVILWHIRGHKRIYVYPMTEDFLRDEDYETYMYSQTEDYLPYTKDMEKSAQCIDLHENELVTWPLNAPHRVENMSFCVSVTTEFPTKESRLKNSAMYANAVLRRNHGRTPNWHKASMPEKIAKAAIGKMWRNMGVLDGLKPADVVSFTVDKNAPDYVRDIEPYQRGF